ncbi:hypothetical protein HanPSC8_Chr05g0225391 [Helianthus annuus]|nr:hypothetical protein HanPSC8_Chr05g0225391 [Helianthus annuus]
MNPRMIDRGLQIQTHYSLNHHTTHRRRYHQHPAVATATTQQPTSSPTQLPRHHLSSFSGHFSDQAPPVYQFQLQHPSHPHVPPYPQQTSTGATASPAWNPFFRPPELRPSSAAPRRRSSGFSDLIAFSKWVFVKDPNPVRKFESWRMGQPVDPFFL